MCGFIAQLVEHRTGIRGGHRFESCWRPEFLASFPHLLKLVGSRWGSWHCLFLSAAQNNFIYCQTHIYRAVAVATFQTSPSPSQLNWVITYDRYNVQKFGRTCTRKPCSPSDTVSKRLSHTGRSHFFFEVNYLIILNHINIKSSLLLY